MISNKVFNLTRNGALLLGQRLVSNFKLKDGELKPNNYIRKFSYKTKCKIRRRLQALIKLSCSNVYYKRECIGYKKHL